jgi:RNA polymerase sigma-70 factor (ECF subfamily)
VIAKEVLEQFIQGKKNGFDRIYEAYSPGMYAICLRYLRSKDDANDVLQETFIKVYSNRNKYDINQPIGAWIKTITIRCALNHLKERSRFQLTDNEYTFDSSEVQAFNEQPQGSLKEKLSKALEKLPAGYRTVFSLFAIDNLTHKEIAEYLNISIGTSKSQYSKAKKLLQQLLQKERIAS